MCFNAHQAVVYCWSINSEQRLDHEQARQKAEMESGKSQRRLGTTHSDIVNGSNVANPLDASSSRTQASRHVIVDSNICSVSSF